MIRHALQLGAPGVLQCAQACSVTASMLLPAGLRRGLATQSGIFGTDVTHPHVFVEKAAAAQDRCKGLMSEVLTSPGDARVVQLMDDMSDELCQTYDAAEACRNIHADQAWRQAATKACISIGAFIAEVNNHPGIYSSLSDTMANYEMAVGSTPASSSSSSTGTELGDDRASSSTGASTSGRSELDRSWLHGNSSSRGRPALTPQQLQAFCPETVMVGSKLKLDMEKAGIHLPPQQQAHMQQLQNASQHFAARFNAALVDPRQLGTVDLGAPSANSSSGIRQRLGALTGSGSRLITLDGSSVGAVLAQEPDARIRQKVYTAAGKGPAANIDLLEHMLLARREMAGMVGCSSYSKYKAWGASLAQEPATINAFLTELAFGVKPVADHELQKLHGLKSGQNRPGSSQSDTVMPWDVDYLLMQARAAAGVTALTRRLQEYTQLPRVLEGFGQIMQRLFGLSLSVFPAPPSEAWAPGVLRCDAHLEGDLVGTVYLDLCSRPGKFPSAVTFPIRCGRQLGDGSYQAPIMALLADFGPSWAAGPGAVRLTLRELRTLAHELGHCCHNLLSRTKYQHLWGTRCAQDMVEVPSHLWEHFVTDPRMLRMLARNANGDPLPDDVCEQVVASRQMFAGLELQQQVLLSIVDQAYHGDRADLVTQQGTGAVWQQAVAPFTSLPVVPGMRPEARIGHFTIYGGAYYSYLYARCLSSAIWDSMLARDPLDRGAGNIIREHLLAPGGSQEPWNVLHKLSPQGSLIRATEGGWAPASTGMLWQRG